MAMAAMSSAPTASIPCSSSHNRELLPSLLPQSKLRRCTTSNHNHLALVSTRNPIAKKFIVRSSESEANPSSSSSSEGSDTATATDEEDVMEVPKGPVSLISALNVEKALRGIPITDADHYGRLGLSMGCSYDQVRVAYQNKVNELSTQGLDEEELNKRLELLKESYNILSSVEERRLYDWSLARSESPERYAWPFEVDITQTPKGGTPPAQEPEDVGPTRLVGYFLLAWVVLAFTLSVALNL